MVTHKSRGSRTAVTTLQFHDQDESNCRLPLLPLTLRHAGKKMRGAMSKDSGVYEILISCPTSTVCVRSPSHGLAPGEIV